MRTIQTGAARNLSAGMRVSSPLITGVMTRSPIVLKEDGLSPSPMEISA
ncbi:MAG: hypothetical protein IIB64_09005 [Proteobacteria bacterium]|nr:hypothetical protein [Pseudomonadota bacterium]